MIQDELERYYNALRWDYTGDSVEDQVGRLMQKLYLQAVAMPETPDELDTFLFMRSATLKTQWLISARIGE